MSDSEKGTIQVDRHPTPEGEDRFFRDEKYRTLRNNQFEQNIRERRRFGIRAYRMAQAWLTFLMFIVVAQLFLKLFGHGLSEKEFITVVTTTTASVFGFWWLVGRYLFPGSHDD